MKDAPSHGLDAVARLANLIGQAVESSPVGITIVDLNGDDQPIVYANEGFYALTGYRAGEVLGRNCRFLQCPATEAGAIEAIRRAVARRQAATVVLRNARSNGATFWNELTLSPLVDPATGDIGFFAGIQIDATDRIEFQVELERLAMTDPLTGLANRRAFLERSGEQVLRWHRYGTPFALVAFDIDRFKRINDRHGHGVGDQVLSRFAAVLAREARETDILGRIGGEEFCATLPYAGADAALALTERLRADLIQPCPPLSGLTFSAGIATPTPTDASIEDVLARADAALYRAKRAGRDRVEHGAPV